MLDLPVPKSAETPRTLLLRWLSTMFGITRSPERALPSFIASDYALMVDCPSAAPGLRMLSSAVAFSSIGAIGFTVHSLIAGLALFPFVVAVGFMVLLLGARQLEILIQRLASERYAGCLATEATIRRQSIPKPDELVAVSQASAVATSRLVRMRAAIGFMMICLVALALGASAPLWLSFLGASAGFGLYNGFIGHRARNGLDPSSIRRIHAALSQPKPSFLWDEVH
jgi:hypothetical protein